MFWGLLLEEGKFYSQKVTKPFHVSMAALEPSGKGGNPVTVNLEQDGMDFILCTLKEETLYQQAVDLNFAQNDEIKFFLSGKGTVHLTGYVVSEEDSDYDDDQEDDSMLEDDPPQLTEIGSKQQKEAEKLSKKLKQPAKKEESDDSDDESDEDSDEDSDEEMESPVKAKKPAVPDTKKVEKKPEKKPEKPAAAKKKAEEEDDDSDEDDSDDESDEEGVIDFKKLMAEASSGDDDDDDDDDEDIDMDEMEEEDDDEEGEEEDEDSDDDSSEEEAPPPKKGKKTPPVTPTTDKKGKKTPQATPTTDSSKTKKEKKTPVSLKEPEPVQSGKKRKEIDSPLVNGVDSHKKSKKNKRESKESLQVKSESPKVTTPKRSIKGGIQVQDVKVGTGPEAATGKYVSVHYTGKLKSNNDVFDSNHVGQKPFKFRLGGNEVIKGWDLGVAGMKVGGKRTLTIPYKMAYGEKGCGSEIPPKADLVFDVELKNVH